MFTIEKVKFLTKEAQNKILKQTIEEARTSIKQPHSIQTIVAEDRDIGLAARMTSKPLSFRCYTLGNNEIMESDNIKLYTGKEIADIFINSVNRYGETFYPITGNITKQIELQYLILFIKEGDKYIPYVRFNIVELIKTSTLSVNQAKSIIDPTPIMNSTYKTLLRINEPKTKGLPNTYLGNTSGEDIYAKAFKGSSPNIVII